MPIPNVHVYLGPRYIVPVCLTGIADAVRRLCEIAESQHHIAGDYLAYRFSIQTGLIGQ